MKHLRIDQSEAATVAPWGAEPADEGDNEEYTSNSIQDWKIA